MGLKRKLSTVAIAFGSLAIAGGIGAPSAGAATPTNLVGHAEYDAVRDGMTPDQVSAVIAQKMIFRQEVRQTFEDGEYVGQIWSYDGSLGDCEQEVVFVFDNAPDGENLGAFGLVDKARSESGCNGIVK
ncbi:hypothetical protein BH10ACT3_BH10ACT3_02800 [soil metagenome]